MGKMKKDMKHTVFLLALIIMIPLSVLLGNTQVQGASLKGANQEYFFTSVEGNSVSSAETGKTTILIFGTTTCGNTRQTLFNIAKSSWVSNPNIRVVFAEISNKTQSEVKTFGDSFNCSAITFCYEENRGSIFNAMQEYTVEATGGMPFTVLIDGNKEIRKALSETQTAEGLLAEINKFFNVDSGEANPPVNLSIAGTENYTFAHEVLTLVNQERAKRGLRGLTLDNELLEFAMQRAAEISVYYSHTRPDGRKYSSITNRGTKKAENIAVGYASPQAVMAAWVSSPGHYANIMDVELTSIGIGCFIDNSGTTNWVQFFDNVPGAASSLTGSKTVTRTVSANTENLHLNTVENQSFICKDKGKTTTLEITHTNQKGIESVLKLSPSDFDFASSDSAVASVNNGVITVLKPGTAVIAASTKGNPAGNVTRTITVANHNYNDKVVNPTGSEEGYTLHTCSACGDSYKDSFVPIDAKAAFAKVPGLKAKSGENSIKLSWKKVSSVKGYYIYQYSGKKWKKIAAVSSGKTSYTVKKLKPAQGFRFGVKAYKTEKGKQVLSKSYASLYTATNPQAVKFTVTAGKKKAAVKWNKVKGADKYEIVYKAGGKGAWKKLKTTKSLQYTKKKLKSGEKYTFAVKACKVYKGKTYTSSIKGKTVKIK